MVAVEIVKNRIIGLLLLFFLTLLILIHFYERLGLGALISTNFAIIGFTHFVDAVGIVTKIINHHSKTETMSKLTVHSQFLQNYFTYNFFFKPKLGHTTL